jgi:hypothetical protein
MKAAHGVMSNIPVAIVPVKDGFESPTFSCLAQFCFGGFKHPSAKLRRLQKDIRRHMKSQGELKRVVSITAYVHYVWDTHDQYPMRGKIPIGIQDKYLYVSSPMRHLPRCPPNPLLPQFDWTTLQHV